MKQIPKSVLVVLGLILIVFVVLIVVGDDSDAGLPAWLAADGSSAAAETRGVGCSVGAVIEFSGTCRLVTQRAPGLGGRFSMRSYTLEARGSTSVTIELRMGDLSPDPSTLDPGAGCDPTDLEADDSRCTKIVVPPPGGEVVMTCPFASSCEVRFGS